MTINEAKISPRQFMFSIICFIQASQVLNAFISNVTYHESWLVVIFAFIIFIPVVFLYSALINRFKDKNLIQMIMQVFGPIFGRIIAVLYLLFFLSLSMLNLADLINITRTSVLQTTPYPILLVMCTLVIAWAIRSGLRVITIYSKLFVFLASFIILGALILLLNVVEINNLFPIFSLKTKNYVQGVHILNTIPFGEVIAFLMITPNVNASKKDTKKYLFIGVSLGALSFFITVLRDVLALGETFSIFVFPSLVTFRLIRITEVLTRVEILFIVILILVLVFKVCILYYASVLTIAQIFNLDKYKNIVLSVGFLLITTSLAFTANPVHHSLSSQNSSPFIWTFFQIVFPLLLFLIAVIFKINSPKKEKEK